MNKISELFTKYGSDKARGYPGFSAGHMYGEFYDSLFEYVKPRKEVNILEVGIQKGGCLRAMKEFIPHANIYGVDIVDVVLEEHRRDDINYIFKDIKDSTVVEQLKGIKFDIIIDDGIHHFDCVEHVIGNFKDSLTHNGFIIVEDCQQPEIWLNDTKRLVDEDTFHVTCEDKRSVNGNYDDYLIIIKKIK